MLAKLALLCTNTSLLTGITLPSIIYSSDDLPVTLSPIMQILCTFDISKLTLSRTICVPQFRLNFLTNLSCI
ncbi:hypothetical protein [Francisella tularensis]|uniref:hypothetical protein n=1 Tax=Francisella tularensis TaxID=263 RepID=UPI0016814951|nr:hypothetical protein [Francisella tularensis]MBD2809076.1 hypothetical protein [Francisella tularensis]